MERKGHRYMAETKRKLYRRKQHIVKTGNMYVVGNAVRMPEAVPENVPEGRPGQDRERERKKRIARRAMWANFTYGIFLAVAVVIVVASCAGYLRLRSEVLSRSENISGLQTELAELTELNDTAYQAAEDSVNLEAIRNRAVHELGMVHSSQGQVVEYERITGDTVKQYDDIPEDGVLAKSGNYTE